MNHIGLFEGIGGFSLAARWMGWETIAWCEWNDFGQQVLRHHFPKAEGYGDIKQTDFTIYRGRCDIITGGFPCQPYSTAGKRLGKEDDRHLWPEMLRAIREIEPTWVVGENVRGLISWNGGLVFDEVQADLEAEGYEVQPFLLPACGVNAPHRRDRVWFIAYSNGSEQSHGRREDTEAQGEVRGNDTGDVSGALRGDGLVANPSSAELQGSLQHRGVGGPWASQRQGGQSMRPIRNQWQDFPTQSPVCGADDGIPRELDSITFPKWRNESIKAYGNAIVPQVALQIFKAIQEYETLITHGTTQPT